MSKCDTYFPSQSYNIHDNKIHEDFQFVEYQA